MAMDAGMHTAGALNGTGQINLYSLAYASRESFLLRAIAPSRENTWAYYLKGVGREF